MALALYRKYRPRTFAEVIGQEHVTEPLSQALRSGRLHHAYLFSGPRGCGKTSSARILARSLNCEQGPTPDPCGVCASCRSLMNDGAGSIDVIEIDAASHGGVDDARELREKAFFAPASSRYKIYVIDEAHMVSSAGFNALLKLVEEPPDYVKFIFATTEPEKVLGTIRSRTHHYPFRLIPPAVLRPYLQQLTEAEGVHVEPAVLPLVVRAGGGSARDTLSVLDQLIAGAGPEGVSYTRAVALLGVTDVALIDEMCDALAAGDGGAAYTTIDRVAEAGHDPRRFASDLLERFRDLIVLQQVPDAVTKGLIDGPADQLEAMAAQATRLGPATLSRCADIVHNGLVEMRGTTAPRLLLELITARMLLPGADDTTGALLQRLERMERRLTLTSEEGVRAHGAPGTSIAVTGPAPTATSPAAVAEPGPGAPAGGIGGISAARAAAAAAARRTPTAPQAAPSASAPAGPDSPGSVAGDAAAPGGAVAPTSGAGGSAGPVAGAPGVALPDSTAPGSDGRIPEAPVSGGPVSAPVSGGPGPTAPISGAPAPGGPVPAAPMSGAPASGGSVQASPVSGAAGSVPAAPVSDAAASGGSVSPAPISGAPASGGLVAAAPVSGGPAAAPPVSGGPAAAPDSYAPGSGAAGSSAPVSGGSVSAVPGTGGPVAGTAVPDAATAQPVAPQARRPEPGAVLPDAPEELPPDNAGAPGQLTAANIREVWPEIIAAVGRKSKKVSALASGATVRELDGQTVVLTFRFPAHAKMVSDQPQLIMDALYEALGGRWSVRCEVSGEAGGVRATGSAAPARGGPAPAQSAPPAAARPAQPSRRREPAPPPAVVESDGDDWPEPARPGGPAPAPDPSGTAPAAVPSPVSTAEKGAVSPVTEAAGLPSQPRSSGPSAATSSGSVTEAAVNAAPTAGTRTAGPVGPPVPPAGASAAGVGASAAGVGASAAGVGASAAGVGASAAGVGASAAGVGASAATGGASAAAGGASAATVGASAAERGATAAGGGPAPVRGSAAASGNPTATGNGPTATGNGPTATGNGPTATGNGPTATGNGPAAKGSGPVAKGGGAAAARAALAARQSGAKHNAAPAGAWSDGSPTEEAPYDPEYDGPARRDAKAALEGFDPGDEPLDDVIDEKTARQSSEQQAMQLLRDAFGAEKISES